MQDYLPTATIDQAYAGPAIQAFARGLKYFDVNSIALDFEQHLKAVTVNVSKGIDVDVPESFGVNLTAHGSADYERQGYQELGSVSTGVTLSAVLPSC